VLYGEYVSPGDFTVNFWMEKFEVEDQDKKAMCCLQQDKVSFSKMLRLQKCHVLILIGRDCMYNDLHRRGITLIRMSMDEEERKIINKVGLGLPM